MKFNSRLQLRYGEKTSTMQNFSCSTCFGKNFRILPSMQRVFVVLAIFDKHSGSLDVANHSVNLPDSTAQNRHKSNKKYRNNFVEIRTAHKTTISPSHTYGSCRCKVSTHQRYHWGNKGFWQGERAADFIGSSHLDQCKDSDTCY